jgi:CxxC motif-containing protein (DUF1111 family)
MHSRNRYLTTVAGAIVGASIFTTTLTIAQTAPADNGTSRFAPRGAVSPEAPPPDLTGRPAAPIFTEAPAAFDGLTNGFDPQGPDFDTLDEDTVVALRSFNDNKFIFSETEGVSDGLGPTYNAQSCRECHQNIVVGGASQITEHRTGRVEANRFVESLGGSLIQSRATYPEVFERVQFQDNVRTFRISTNTLGAGFVEAIANDTLASIRAGQPSGIRGSLIPVPVMEANNASRYGRFGWKNQHASLESFAADAYLNEMGITSPLLPVENTSLGKFVGYGTDYDPVADPEDDGVDLKAFANFMRSTKAPPRGTIDNDVLMGETVFQNVGCSGCHVASIRTAAAGTSINGGAMTVNPAVGSKVIHPYSDFLMHDIGTGDGIPVLPTTQFAGTANQIRTAPLWALRTRNRLMHDGLSFTKEEAIARHGGQAGRARNAFTQLSNAEKVVMMKFLDSL